MDEVKPKALGEALVGATAEVARLNRLVAELERELRGANDRYKQLERTYQHLSDTWMAFQATARPRVRDVQRAEGVGEFARLLVTALAPHMTDEDKKAITEGLIRQAYLPGEFDKDG